jgi:hypothetical protein
MVVKLLLAPTIAMDEGFIRALTGLPSIVPPMKSLGPFRTYKIKAVYIE